MLYRNYGSEALKVSAIGFGAGHIGGENLSEAEVGRLLNEVLDSGITLFDTARGYNLSEERIGRHLAHRRGETILSTKVGYGIVGRDDWSYDGIVDGVDLALKNLRTEYIDIVHLHSCSLVILQRGEVTSALERCKHEGKIRKIAYSGENQELIEAISSKVFDGIQCSVNVCDQKSAREFLPFAAAKRMGIIAKRPLANVPWRHETLPSGQYVENYWKRFKTMELDRLGLNWQEVALRYVLFHTDISSAIIGSTNIENIRNNCKIMEKGPLPFEIVHLLHSKFDGYKNEWNGEV